MFILLPYLYKHDLLSHVVRSLFKALSYSLLTQIPISPKSEGIVLLTNSSLNAFG
nr:MAG TPA: hypothetical protein [Caudoviricetes sp.]